jgi:transmembrane sensor
LEDIKIQRFFKGESTEKGAREVLNWLVSNKNEKEAGDLIEKYLGDYHNGTDWDYQNSWSEFRKKIDNGHQVSKEKNDWYEELKSYRTGKQENSRIGWMYKIAASIAFLLLSSVALFYIFNEYNKVEFAQLSPVENITKSTSKGQKLTIFLRDGTRVILNSESELVYPEFFSDSVRMVELKGEAFFEVTRDDTKPFKVLCKNTITEVLGTSFNINSDPETHKVQVALVSGKVRVDVLNDHEILASSVELHPGDAAYIVQERVNVSSFDHNRTVLWKDGILFFNKVDFNTMIRELESWYGVDIEVHGRANADKKHYSGRFDNESLQNVLESIGFSKDFNYRITGKTVILTIN